MSHRLPIDIYFDFICPWCLIGKRQLQVAVKLLKKSHPDIEVVLNWRGVQLLPQMPVDGVPFGAFYLQRLGSTTAVRMRQEQVRQAALAVDVDIDFSKIPRMPNTARAQHFLKNAQKLGDATLSDRLLEGIFSAYFFHSENIADLFVLKKIATYCGYTEEDINFMSADIEQPFISANTGGRGVPYFVFENGFAMAGAQPAKAIYKAMLDTVEMQGQCV